MKPTKDYSIEIGDIRLPIIVKKHRTARKLIIRYSPREKALRLTLPQRASLKQGLDFINEKREWIFTQVNKYKHEENKPDNERFFDGQIISLLGKKYKIEHAGGRGLVSEEEGDILRVHGDKEFLAKRLERFLQQKARDEIVPLAEQFAQCLDVKIKKISLRDTTSRWGSCSRDGSLSFSWRLILAPHEVLKYVVVHEVAHIREHNHSPAFWKIVAELDPNFKHSRRWLKLHGSSLYTA